MTDDLTGLLALSIEMAKWRKRVQELLSRKAKDTTPIQFSPKRSSGPRLVPDGQPEWHTIAGQAALPPPVYGPRCHECGERVFAGADALHDLAGVCGPCRATLRGTIAAPPLHAEPDGPPREAA